MYVDIEVGTMGEWCALELYIDNVAPCFCTKVFLFYSMLTVKGY